MTFLLDTNVISEVQRPKPELRVLEWLDRVDEDRTFISAITIGEIARGVAQLDHGRRKEALRGWIQTDLPNRFGNRLLPIDREIAVIWGELMASARRKGRGLGAMDAWIAATAARHALIVVTRNTRDFEDLGLELFDPWTASGA